MSTNKILGAVILGAAAGAVLGVLFEPEKGSDTRKKILDTANDLAEELKFKIEEGKELAGKLKNSIMNSSEELVNRAKDEANNMMNKGKQSVNQN